jgi:hypothetical protein
MSLIDTARSVFLLARRGATLELQQKIMQLREEALALQEENVKLKARVAELEGRAEGGESLTFDGTGFWGPEDGPGK